MKMLEAVYGSSIEGSAQLRLCIDRVEKREQSWEQFGSIPRKSVRAWKSDSAEIM